MSPDQLPTTVYVRLIGEGVDVWRPVAASRVGDMYRLDEPQPDDELWEFGPGTLVRCKLRHFEGEPQKRLVAIERIPATSGVSPDARHPPMKT